MKGMGGISTKTAIVLGGVVAVAIALIIIGGSLPYRPGKTKAFKASQIFVRRRLKAPDSAQFPYVNEATVDDLGEGSYHVRSYVTAVNSFNARLRMNYECTLHYEDTGKWTCKDIRLEK